MVLTDFVVAFVARDGMPQEDPEAFLASWRTLGVVIVVNAVLTAVAA